MKALLELFFFTLLLTIGASLDCETCMVFNTDNIECQKKTCDAGQDTCVVGVSKTSVDGQSILSSVKTCQSSDICNLLAPVHMHFGKDRVMQANGDCCTGDVCITASPQLPPVNTTTNGKQCPACFSLASCNPEMVDCTGSEDYCFEVVTQLMAGQSMSTTLKGCTTESFCTAIQSGKVNLANIGVSLAKAECQPASRAVPSA
ncbi:phospholipase A2 inhibitor gamma subunit B-like [Podarcis raffonei]|uniref:phospholipase A2 inhibitor gamma subunit B-like n=1 Tax=Podarcis raffonei TaxID=65483 RepID=UPI0023299754|nr:phospholipase A2 inhibitor gamma subunit B-like [Podarcis raffonei]